MNPEQLHTRPNPRHIEDGSSIFAGKPPELKDYQLASNYPDSDSVQIDTSDLPESVVRTTRLLLINNLGLVQDDIAKALDISLYSLEATSQKPEDIRLKKDDIEKLATSSLGKVILSRQNHRKKHAQEAKIAETTKKLEEETLRQQEIIKRRVSTRKSRARKREYKARLRGERVRQQNQLEAQIQASAINRKRYSLIENRAQEIEERSTILATLSDDEVFALSKITIPAKNIATETGFSNTYFLRRRTALMEKFGVKNKIDLALWAYNHGVQYDLPEISDLSIFSIRERQVSLHLSRSNEEVARELGITIHMLRLDLESLFTKTGARSREELALTAEANYFRPLTEELEETSINPLLEKLTPYQREVATRVYLPSSLIAGELGKNEGAIQETMKRCLRVLGVGSSMQLTKELLKSGYEFEGIKKVAKPLHELLPKNQLEVARLIHFSNEEIAEKLGVDKDRAKSLVSRARRTIHARSRAEMMIMVSLYDTGEDIALETKTRPEQFQERIGVSEDLSSNDLKELLSATSANQRRAIIAYFFSEAEPSWNDLGKKFGVSYTVARKNAYRGIDNIKMYLEEKRVRENDPNYIHPKKAKLLDIMGVGIDAFNEAWIDQDSNDENMKFVKDYYLSEESISWSKIAKKHGVSPTKARESASRAINSLKEKLVV